MTDKKVTPIQTARTWAREHSTVSGCIAVEYLTPKGRGGRRGMGLRRDHYLVENGKVAKLTSRTITRPDGPSLKSFNGYCYNCGAIFLEPILRCCYVPNPRAGQPANNAYAPDSVYASVYAELGGAVLCPDCAEDPAVFGFDDGRMPLPQVGKYIARLGGGTTECTRHPLAVLGLED